MFDAESSLTVMLQYHSPVMSAPEQIQLLMLWTHLYVPPSFFSVLSVFVTEHKQTNTIQHYLLRGDRQ